jgi:hypothetical protein
VLQLVRLHPLSADQAVMAALAEAALAGDFLPKLGLDRLWDLF